MHAVNLLTCQNNCVVCTQYTYFCLIVAMEKSDDYRFKGLFDQLDTDGDGVIDVQELANAFQLKHLLNARKHAAVMKLTKSFIF